MWRWVISLATAIKQIILIHKRIVMVYAPIWKDTYYTTTAASITYTVKQNGSTLFIGKAVKLPGASTVEININEICKNFLSNELPDFRNVSTATTYTNSEACKTFQLYQGSTLLETYVFLYDWSYTDWNGGSKSMGLPINGHYESTMLVFSSYTSSNVVYNTITFPGGNYCGDMALYYQTAGGGWCSFLCEGVVKRTDNLTPYTYTKSVKNTSNNFENTKYSIEYDRTYVINSGWLSDSESKNLAENLLKSTRVYAHDLKTDEIFPVVITDTSIQYKTYVSNSRKPVNYTINISSSQSRIRR